MSPRHRPSVPSALATSVHSIANPARKRKRSTDALAKINAPMSSTTTIPANVALSASISKRPRKSKNGNSEWAVANVPQHLQQHRGNFNDGSSLLDGKLSNTLSTTNIVNGKSLRARHPKVVVAATHPGSIEACAAILVSIDKHAYSRAVLRDADALAERIVLPMSFPWHQSGEEELVQMIARDIDEMSGVLFAGEPETKGPPEYFASGSSASVRRSSDPGIIEYEVLSEASMVRRQCQLPFQSANCQIEDASLPGELSLGMLHQARAMVQKQQQFERQQRKTTLISFNLASTSTRSTVLDICKKGRHPLVLSAILPVEIQRGTRTTRLLADGIAEQFGTYDCRHGLPKEAEDKARCRAGRTRKLWTKKAPSSSTIVSMLTGEPMLSGSWRRPRDVTVGLRINGILLSSNTPGLPLLRERHPDLHSSIVENEILAVSCRNEVPLDESKQCRLDVDSFVSSCLAKGRPLVGKNGLNPSYITASIMHGQKSLVLSVLPPTLDCFPAEGGILYTACSGVGAMVLADDATTDPISAVLDITSHQRKVCTICWSSSAGKPVSECAGCGLVVHSQCYGRRSVGSLWKCDVCSDQLSAEERSANNAVASRDHRWGISCADCGLRGSSLVRDEDGKFVHNVCRIWRPAKPFVGKSACALCGSYSSQLARCAAKNCHIEFHPLCALMTSNAADLHYQALKKPAANGAEAHRDRFLCTQFRLARLEVGSRASNTVETVPVAFCGIHNCDRKDDLYGLPPGGKHLDGSMHIPPLRNK